MPAYDNSAFSYDPNQGTTPGDFDSTSEGSFLWGALSGANSRNAAKRQAYGQNQAMNLWGSVAKQGPTAEAMSNPHAYDPNYEGLRQIADSQGLTPGATSAYQAMAQRTGEQAGAQRQAIAQQMQARGLGASGLQYAAQLQAGQAGADTSALGGYQAVAQGEQARNQAVSQMAGIRAHQQSDYAQAQTDALQQQYENYMNAVAGATGQYNRGSDYAEKRREEANQQQNDIIGGVLDEIKKAV